MNRQYTHPYAEPRKKPDPSARQPEQLADLSNLYNGVERTSAWDSDSRSARGGWGTHGPPRSRGRVDFLRVAGTISEGRFRYSRRNSMPSSVRNLQQAVQAHISKGGDTHQSARRLLHANKATRTQLALWSADLPMHASRHLKGQQGNGSDVQMSSQVRVRGRRPRLDTCHHSHCTSLTSLAHCWLAEKIWL